MEASVAHERRARVAGSEPGAGATPHAAALDPAAADARRAASGDLAAFERLYRATAGRVFAVCRRLAGDAAEAEELTQQVFVRAWEKLPTFEGRSAFSTWLHRLAVNVAIEAQRRRGRRLTWEVLADEPAGDRTGGPAPAADERLDLERAVAGLPEGARQVFVLFDVEGYSHTEIAGLMQVTEGTSKAQLHRARRLLQEALQR